MNKVLMTPEDFAELYKRRPRCQKGSGLSLPTKKPHIVKNVRGKFIARYYTRTNPTHVLMAKTFASRLNEGEVYANR